MRLSSIPNFRDIGGVGTVDGGLVREGLIFRSEAMLQPVEEDAIVLCDIGFMLVCDLRSDSERRDAPNSWWAGRGVEMLDMDVLAGTTSPRAWDSLRRDPSADGAAAAMRSVYGELPAAAAPHLATIFARMAAGDLPLLVHCTAGKDRTGFFCAMILTAIGVQRKDVIADYLASAGRATAAVVDHTRLMVEYMAGPVSDEALMALIGVEQAYIETSLARIDAEFGSVSAYLREAAGLDDNRMRAIRERVLL